LNIDQCLSYATDTIAQSIGICIKAKDEYKARRETERQRGREKRSWRATTLY